ncbi:tetraspanin-11-like [Babylonia areolata]|uniref:tetraspanin-11-like n=1 Tax=Babylonia areolata TaxID=304850 RepID=UPI003FD14824
MGRFKLPHVEDLSLRVRALRYFMTIFCFFFVVFGAGVLASAAILAAGRPAECSFLEEFLTGVYLLLAAGCLTVFFCLITFRHIYRSSSSGDFTSVLFVLVVVMVMQVIAAIAGHVHNARASESGGGGLESAMNLTWREYYHHHHHDQDSRACVDRLQKEFACCGVLNGDAEWLWLALSANLSVPRPYPSSCLCSAGSDDADGGEECMVRNDSFSNAGGSAAQRGGSRVGVPLSRSCAELSVRHAAGPASGGPRDNGGGVLPPSGGVLCAASHR